MAGRSETGPARRRNEDRFVAARLGREPRVLATSLEAETVDLPATEGTAWLLAVADGMGGHAHGDRASAIGLQTLLANAPDPALEPEALRRGLLAAFRAGADRVRESSPAGAGKPMGTTLSVAWASGGSLLVLHAGDSRVYRFRDGSLTQLTRDHTLARRLVERGAATEDEMRESPLAHQLVRSLGGGVGKDDPDLVDEDLRPGDRLLLCTDGLTGVLDDGEIAVSLRNRPGDEAVVGELIARALERETQDNVTVLVATLEAGP